MSGAVGGLAGRVIAVTRAKLQSEEMVAAIRAAGGRAEVYPLIDIAWISLDRLREAAMGRPDAFIFTSENGVAALSQALGASVPLTGRAYCVGAATARRAELLGLGAVAPPAPHSADRLAEFLCTALAPRMHVLWPRGNLADPAWLAPLRTAGIDVSDLVVYETKTGGAAGQLARDVRDRKVDALTFASASAADAFAQAWEDAGQLDQPGQPIFAIGSRTSAALARRGLAVAACARIASAAALVDAVSAYYQGDYS